VGEAIALEADAILTFGGGSVIDAGKALAASVADRGRPAPGHIAVHFYGVTEAGAGECDRAPTRFKRSFADQRAVPQVVILDAELAAETPDRLWHGSGVKAIDHAVEGMLASGERPLSDPLAALGIRSLALNLRHRVRRLACQIAAWQCYAAPANVELGISHRIGHVLGGSYGIPHSLTSGITLPPVIRALSAANPGVIGLVDTALNPSRTLDLDGAGGDPARAASRLAALVTSLSLPGRLRDVGLTAAQLPAIAEQVEATSPDQVRALGGSSALECVLRDAY
jgi:maleylacetate reductase